MNVHFVVTQHSDGETSSFIGTAYWEGRGRTEVTYQFPIKKNKTPSLNICPVSNTVSCYGEIRIKIQLGLGSPRLELKGHRSLLHRTTRGQLSTRLHGASCSSLDPDGISSTNSSPGAPGSVGGHIPLRGYWSGPSPQEPGEEREPVSPRKIRPLS